MGVCKIAGNGLEQTHRRGRTWRWRSRAFGDDSRKSKLSESSQPCRRYNLHLNIYQVSAVRIPGNPRILPGIVECTTVSGSSNQIDNAKAAIAFPISDTEFKSRQNAFPSAAQNHYRRTSLQLCSGHNTLSLT